MNNQYEAVYLQEARKLVSHQLSLGYELVALHTYTTIDGAPVYWRIRLKNANGKQVLPMHKDNGGRFVLKEPSFDSKKKPIYRLHDLMCRPGEPVYVVEGEACADKLIKVGLLATTSGSWNSAQNADWSLLAGRNIIIWRDVNDVGLKYALQVTDVLLKLQCSVKWVDVKKLNLPDGGDCVDWLIAHPDAVKATIEKLPLINSSNTGGDNTNHNSQIDYPRFEVKDDGVFYCKDINDSIRLCSRLVIKALTRDADGINWGRVLEFEDADGGLHNWTMPMELLGGNGDELAKELLRLGLRVSPGSAVRKLLVEYITNSETNERVRCVLTTGWHHSCFVLPCKVFGESSETILLQSESVISSNCHVNGELNDWQENISKYCSGNSRLIFAIALAFAAPLLKISGAESGGFHFRGESSAGKTTTLLLAASVWGGKNYVQNWRATDNALEGLAAQHNDMLLILDELSQIDSKVAGEVAYMLANGQGKARAYKNGQARQRLNWRLLFLSSGEISLASHMQEAGRKVKAGQEVRMVDIPAYAGCEKGIFETLHSFPNGAMFSETLKAACENYHGIAGDMFLQQLTSIDSSLHAKIQNLQAKFMQVLPAGTHGQVKRVAQRFALVAAAGELASEFGITGWQEGESIQAAKVCFDAWLNTRECGAGSREKDYALEQVRHFFQECLMILKLIKIKLLHIVVQVLERVMVIFMFIQKHLKMKCAKVWDHQKKSQNL